MHRSDYPTPLLTFDARSSITRKVAAERGGCSYDSAIRWAVRHGIAAQISGPGGQWRIHAAGWEALLSGDYQAIADLKANNLTEAVASYFNKARSRTSNALSGRAA